MFYLFLQFFFRNIIYIIFFLESFISFLFFVFNRFQLYIYILYEKMYIDKLIGFIFFFFKIYLLIFFFPILFYNFVLSFTTLIIKLLGYVYPFGFVGADNSKFLHDPESGKYHDNLVFQPLYLS